MSEQENSLLATRQEAEAAPICLEELQGGPNRFKNDAGARAAERMRAKAAAVARRTARIFRFIVASLALLTLTGLGGVGWYGWETRITGTVTDERPCGALIGERQLTGYRQYSYPFNEVFGFRFIDTSKIDEKTIIRMNGSALHVVGIDKKDWWALKIDQGETGIWTLKHATTYVFVAFGKTNVVPYNAFCK